MRTAVDSNVLSAVWSGEPPAADIARGLAEAKSLGGLVVCAPVYVELLAYPKSTESFLNRFLGDTGISVEFELSESVWREAGRRFARYAARRRRSTREGPKRLLVDFLIGAHALAQADRLMTLDAGRYARDFPDLKLL